MAQFSAYKNKNPKTKKTYPFLIDIQSDLLAQLRTTVVIPLSKVSQTNNQIMTKLCPIVEIDGNEYAALTQQIAGIDRNILGEEIINLSKYRADFVDAVDFIILGI